MPSMHENNRFGSYKSLSKWVPKSQLVLINVLSGINLLRSKTTQGFARNIRLVVK